MILLVTIVTLAIGTKPVYALNSCYAVADEGDRFVALNHTNGKTTNIGPLGVPDVEAITFEPTTSRLFAANANQLGLIDIVTGAYSLIGQFGSGNGSEGVINFDDVDGLTFDPTTGVFYGVQRRVVGDPPVLPVAPDVLFQIDPTTGSFVPGVFNGADYVVIGVTQTDEADIDDIAIHPQTGVLYGIANDGGVGGALVIIDKQTGAITEIGSMSDADNADNIIDDIEGLDFFDNGDLYGSSGDAEPIINGYDDRNKLFRIDLTTAQATFVGKFPAGYGDYEGVACLTANIADDDNDGIVNAGEDRNGDGDITNDDTDGDGIPDYLDPDDDGDNVLTIDEDPGSSGNVRNDDTDGDGVPNYLDNDDDGDGKLTKDEDLNANGSPADDDSDDDSVPNYLEAGDTDGDQTPDELDNDDDGDGIPTRDEDVDDSASPLNDDSDGDGLPNYRDPDDDNDSVPTQLELRAGAPDDFDGDQIPNHLDTDSDDDGINDGQEWSSGPDDLLENCTASVSACTVNDMDADNALNFVDTDADNDGISDQVEGVTDSDFDGIPDWLDAVMGSFVFLPVVGG